MNLAWEFEDDNIVKYERSPERRSGADRRNDRQMKKKDAGHAADRSENPQPLPHNRFIGDFG